MSWLKKITFGIRVTFGKKVEVKPTLAVGVDWDQAGNVVIAQAQEVLGEGRRDRDREGAEDDQDKGSQDEKGR